MYCLTATQQRNETMERKYKGWIIERMEDGHYNMRPEDVEQWTDAAERLKDAKAMIDRMTEQKGNETMSKIETVEVTAETINKELVKAVKTDARVARKLVLEVHPFAAEILKKETDGAWPTKSLTVKMIDASQTLQDMFVGLSQADRSNHVRDIKFVSENFDAVVAEGETNGWRKIDAMRKAIQKVQKAAEEPTEEPSEEAPEDMTPNGQRDDYASSIFALLLQAEQAGHDPAEVIQDVVNLFKNK
jgi:hypothetical protein